jgi:hypothetical protein
MSRPMFEERLLDGLQREIQLRAAEAHEAAEAGAGVEAGKGPVRACVRALLTRLAPRRIAVVATACAAAWAAAVVVPGSPTDSTAYAVERHGDGSVEVVLRSQAISVADQRELADKVRPWGIRVEVDVADLRYVVCTQNGEKLVELRTVDTWGTAEPRVAWTVTLRRGDVLAFEKARGGSEPRAVTRYEIKALEVTGESEPCVPVKRASPGD